MLIIYIKYVKKILNNYTNKPTDIWKLINKLNRTLHKHLIFYIKYH
jgi:hypothetical protein